MIDFVKNNAKTCPRDRSLMALDVGRKTIGIALSAPPYGIVTPLTTLKRTKFTKDMNSIAALVKDYDVGGFVIGLPLNMDDSEGAAAQSIRDFAREMLNCPDVVGESPWVTLQDERLSTHAVHDVVDDIVDKKKRGQAKGKGMLDALAAKVILEDALIVLNA